MLHDLVQNLGTFLYEAFVLKLSWWAAVGYLGTLLFGTRFLLQWIASERAGRSVFPMAFWLFSISGGLLTLAYAIHIKDPVFILGQSLGVFIYLRNVYFTMRERRAPAPAM